MIEASPCCGAKVYATLAAGVLVGTCIKCGEWVCRLNTTTGLTELIERGGSPWSDMTPGEEAGT